MAAHEAGLYCRSEYRLKHRWLPFTFAPAGRALGRMSTQGVASLALGYGQAGLSARMLRVARFVYR